jgi:hypothetical protein
VSRRTFAHAHRQIKPEQLAPWPSLSPDAPTPLDTAGLGTRCRAGQRHVFAEDLLVHRRLRSPFARRSMPRRALRVFPLGGSEPPNPEAGLVRQPGVENGQRNTIDKQAFDGVRCSWRLNSYTWPLTASHDRQGTTQHNCHADDMHRTMASSRVCKTPNRHLRLWLARHGRSFLLIRL